MFFERKNLIILFKGKVFERLFKLILTNSFKKQKIDQTDDIDLMLGS